MLFRSIGSVDPTSVTPKVGKSINTEVVRFTADDGTLGGTGVGRENSITQIALIIYQSITTREDSTAKRTLMQITARARQAVMRYRTTIVGNVQYWYRIDVGREGTAYYSGAAWRVSITSFNICTQQTRT